MSAQPPGHNLFEQLSQVLSHAQGGSRTTPGWWNSFRGQETFPFENHAIINIAKSAMFNLALLNPGTTVYECKGADQLTDLILDIQDVADQIELRVVLLKYRDQNQFGFLVDKDTAVSLELSETGAFNFHGVTLDPQRAKILAKDIKMALTPSPDE